MNGDYKELIEYLNKKFTDIDGKFLIVNSRLLNIAEEVGKKTDKDDFNNLLTSIDAYSKKADDYFQEMLMLSQKIDRHEKWLHQMAEKLGVKLEY